MKAPVLYVVSRWGEPTETFIRREVAALLSAGGEVVVLSLKEPLRAAADPQVVHLNGLRLFKAAAMTVLRCPMRSARALCRVLLHSRRGTVLGHAAGVLHGLAAAAVIENVAFVHAHFAWVSATAADVVASCKGLAFGVMPHAFDIYDRRVQDRYLTNKLRRASLVVVESDRIAADVREAHGVEARTLRIGVPRELTEVPERPPPGRVRVISVGSLRPKKGHDVLLVAVADLPVELTIVGGGPEEQALHALADSLRITDRVRFTGALSALDVIDELDRHDIFVLASRIDHSGDRDGVPNVLIEAMARHLPVVATDVGGVADLVCGIGVVVGPDDPEEIREAIRRWIDDPDARAAAAEAGHRRVCDEYVAEDNVRWLLSQFHLLADS